MIPAITGPVSFHYYSNFKNYSGHNNLTANNTKYQLNIKNKTFFKSVNDSVTKTSQISRRRNPVAEINVADKLQRMVLEFKSLLEPIDRVKRLLHYAANLDPPDETIRAPENRVAGCSVEVWLDVKMDEFGRIRFRADSDSEITKGFCWCLIWILDGAEPEEVLKVKIGNLDAMNVGLYGKAQSRVNTWNNVLIAMQKRTQALVAEKEANKSSVISSSQACRC